MKSLLNFARIGVILGFGVMPITSITIGRPGKVMISVAQIEDDLATVVSNFTQYDGNLHLFFQQGEPLTQGLGTLRSEARTYFCLLPKNLGNISAADASTIEKSVASIQATLIDICQTIRANTDIATTAVVPVARALSTFQPPTSRIGRPIHAPFIPIEEQARAVSAFRPSTTSPARRPTNIDPFQPIIPPSRATEHASPRAVTFRTVREATDTGSSAGPIGRPVPPIGPITVSAFRSSTTTNTGPTGRPIDPVQPIISPLQLIELPPDSAISAVRQATNIGSVGPTITPIAPGLPPVTHNFDVPSPISLLRTDLTNFQTAFDELLNVLQVAVPANITGEFASLKAQFLSKCPSMNFMTL